MVLCTHWVLAQPSSNPIYVSGDYPSAPLQQFLERLSAEHGLSFYYQPAWLPTAPLPAKKVDKVLLEDFLEELLTNTPLGFIEYGGYAVLLAPRDQLEAGFSRDQYLMRRKQANLVAQAEVLERTTLGTEGGSRAGGKANVLGKISDAVTGEPLAGAAFVVSTAELATTSDNEGNFKLNLPTGEHVLEIRYVGYQTKKLIISVLSDAVWRVPLEPQPYELQQVTVEGTRTDQVQNAQIGVLQVSPRDIKQMPTFLGEPDLVKTLLSLPGVSTVGEGASGFNVRGGNIDQNLVLLDHLPVFNTSHALGLFTAINPDIIQSVELYKGNIPAQFGGRTASVLDIRLKPGSYQLTNVQGAIGPVTSKLTIETPLVREKSAILLSGRASYSDWVLRLLSDPDLERSSAMFYDLNAKIYQKIGKSGTLSAQAFSSYDRFQYSNEYGFSWRSRAFSAQWDQFFGKEVSSSLSIHRGLTDNESFVPEGVGAFSLTNGIHLWKIREDILITRFAKHSINMGFEGILYQTPSERLRPTGSISGIVPKSVEKQDGREWSVYLSDEYELSPQLTISAGLRLSNFAQIGPSTQYEYQAGVPKTDNTIVDSVQYGKGEVAASYRGLEPRLSVKYQLDPQTSVKAGYSRVYQYVHLISNTAASVPVDTWQVSNPFVRPQLSDNFSVGVFRNLRNNRYEASVEVFYRGLGQVLDYKDIPILLVNANLETELLSGRGRGYGAEVLLRKSAGALTGWIAYTYARSVRQVVGPTRAETINRGEWYAANFDQPHTLNFVMTHTNPHQNVFSVSFTYRSGRPISVPFASYLYDGILVPHFDLRNNYRIPSYQRLDVSYTFNTSPFRRRRYRDSLTLGVYNLLGRKNAFSVYFRRNPETGTTAYQLAVLGSAFPSITYNFKF